MPTQLTLGVQLRETATFNNFYTTTNKTLVDFLKSIFSLQQFSFVYLWGEHGVGRSHLLQACCHYADASSMSSLYIPLKQYQTFSPEEIFEGLEQLSLICIDDVESIAGNNTWEENLFYLYNRLQTESKRLIIVGDQSSSVIPIKLPDLRSRLISGVSFKVLGLTDEQKLEALQKHAYSRGIVLSLKVARYLLHHYSRNMADLLERLEILEKVSLQEQRRITIPFIREILKCQKIDTT